MNKAEKELETIIADNIHGSTEILYLINKHFQNYSDNRNHLISASKKIKIKLKHFPVIIEFIKNVDKLIKANNQSGLKVLLNGLIDSENKVYNKFFETYFHYLKNCRNILTISHSKTLINIFPRWARKNKNLHITVCESRPMNEGCIMAEELSKNKVMVNIIPESMIGKIIKETDAVIIGADQILPYGNIINKTGSRILAITAKFEKVPFYVIASEKKIIIQKHYSNSIQNKFIRTEIGKKVKFINDNFEEVEKELITKIFLIKS